MILVDTSVLIAFFKGEDNEGSKKLEYLLRQKIPIGICSVVFQEILQGAVSEKEYQILSKYLETQHFYHPIDPVGSYSRAAKIYLDCRKRGITIRSTIDCLIAQIALEHNLLLLHDDKDFAAMAKVVPLRFY